MGLHIFVDADLGTPKARAVDASVEVPPIASGRDPMVATAQLTPSQSLAYVCI